MGPTKQNDSMRRCRSELRIPEGERRKYLLLNPNVSVEDVYGVLQSVAEAKLERKESLTEFKKQRLRELLVARANEKKALMRELIVKKNGEALALLVVEEQRRFMRRRRMGITDGGLRVSQSMDQLL